MKGKIVAVAAVVLLVVAIVVIVFIFVLPQGARMNGVASPNVKFVSFEADIQDLKVGETSRLFYNVQNYEDRAVNDSRVTIVIEPAGSEPYISISNQTTVLPPLLAKNAATGDMKASLTATGSPAKEATYTVKGILTVEGVQTDVKQLDLKIRQE